MFKRNEGILDRIVRLVLGIVLLPTGLFLLGVLESSVPGLVIAILGAIGLFTSLTGFCLVYVPFGISTLEKERELIDRCKSMMASWRSGQPGAGQMCWPDPKSIEETHHQQG